MDPTDRVDATARPRSALEVFWRPGCPYCAQLRRELDRRGVSGRWRNIWTDPKARAIVRAANAGNETVPTVRVGGRTLTNPIWADLAPLLGDEIRTTGPTAHHLRHRAGVTLSWLLIAALVAAGLMLERAGYMGLSWALDAVAVGSWWLTRPLRR